MCYISSCALRFLEPYKDSNLLMQDRCSSPYRLSWIDAEMLSANKRIINIGMELMGAQTLQRLAAENDARAHTTRAAKNVFKQIASEGLRAALDDRDRPFGDSRAKVTGPEIRDAEGSLVTDE